MFKSSKKRDINPNNFDMELDRQLNAIKQDNYCVSSLDKRNQQIVNIIDEAVYELQGQPECSDDSIRHFKPKSNMHQTQKERRNKPIQIERQSTIPLRVQGEMEMRNSQPVKPFVSNPIWNLCTNRQIIEILQLNFDSYVQQQPISTEDFIKKMVLHFVGVAVGDEELQQIRKIVGQQITTTSVEVISLNALQILAKKVKLQHYFMQSLIQGRIQIKIKELNRQNKAIVQEVNQKAEKTAFKQRNLQQRLDQISKKEMHLNEKERSLALKHKDLLQREQMFKRTLQDKSQRLLEDCSSKISEKVKEAEKKLAQLDRNIKYKIQLLERRAETLRTLKNQKIDVQAKKVTGESDAKIKMRRLQKELQSMEKQHQTQIEQYEAEEKDFIKTISLLQDKLNKHEKKYQKMQEKYAYLEEQLNSFKIKQQQSKLKNSQHMAYYEKATGQQQQVSQPLTSKTTRSQTLKKKTKGRHLQSIIVFYEYVLQMHYAKDTCIKKQLQLKFHQQITGLVPLIVSLLCSNQTDDIPNSNAPHYLVLSICKAMFEEHYESGIYGRDHILQIIQTETAIPKQASQKKMQSKEITQLLQIPFKSTSKISIFLLLLPIFDLQQQHPTFLQSVFNQITHLIESHSGFGSNDLLISQIDLLQSKESIYFLIAQFISPLSLCISKSQQTNKSFRKNTISNCIIIIDFMIMLSNEWGKSKGNTSPFLHCQSIILTTFMNLMQCIVRIYLSNLSNNKQFQLKQIDSLEEITEKISILLQRIIYQNKNGHAFQSQSKQLHQLYGSMRQLNNSNGQRYALIIANLTSILDMISLQL